jgi:hypothetical protein
VRRCESHAVVSRGGLHWLWSRTSRGALDESTPSRSGRDLVRSFLIRVPQPSTWLATSSAAAPCSTLHPPLSPLIVAFSKDVAEPASLLPCGILGREDMYSRTMKRSEQWAPSYRHRARFSIPVRQLAGDGCVVHFWVYMGPIVLSY